MKRTMVVLAMAGLLLVSAGLISAAPSEGQIPPTGQLISQCIYLGWFGAGSLVPVCRFHAQPHRPVTRCHHGFHLNLRTGSGAPREYSGSGRCCWSGPGEGS
jgi:hypothetical protein